MVILLREVGPYRIIFTNACDITVAMVILLKYFGIIFMNMCVYYFRYSRHS
jgi:hypothetical protein